MSKRDKPMTNFEFIHSLDISGLAPLLIEFKEVDDWDYDWDDEPYVCGSHTVFITSDNEEFGSLDLALDHEEWWLNQPYVKNV